VTKGRVVEQDVLTAYRDRVERGLVQALDGNAPLRSLLRYHIGLEDEGGRPASTPAKFLRPSIVLFVAEELGGDADVALPSAVAIELMHGFSLIHDDIQDQDRVRRGRPALWTICGIEQAINAGDLMHALAIETALRSSPDAAMCLLRAAREMIEGQSLDLAFERQDVTADGYLTMIDRKTGALLRCAFELGGVAAGVDSRVRSSLVALGNAVGRAFQIKDDVLGIWGSDDVLGKATGSDIRRRKKTLPVVLLFAATAGDDAAALRTLYRRSSPEGETAATELAAIVARLDALHIRDACEAMIDRYLDLALRRARELPFDAAARTRMERLIGYLARRER